MKKQHTVLLAAILPFLSLAGCGSGNHTVQNHNAAPQSSAQRGEEKMPTQSPMFNEILASAKGIPPGEYNDVSHIVTKYIPIGTSKQQTKIILEQMNHRHTEKERFIRTGYRGNNPPFVPNPGISIELHFNNLDYLESINAQYRYYQ